MTSEWIGIIFAFLLGLFNLIYNWRINKKTLFINSVTSERVKWITRMQETLSSFCGLVYHVESNTNLSTEKKQELIQEIDRLRMLIKIQLNPRGDHDLGIKQQLDSLDLFKGSGGTIISSTLESIVDKGQRLLKEEWEKVKEESKSGDLKENETWINKLKRKCCS